MTMGCMVFINASSFAEEAARPMNEQRAAAIEARKTKIAEKRAIFESLPPEEQQASIQAKREQI